MFDDAGANMKGFFMGLWFFERISGNILFNFVVDVEKGVI